MQRTHMSYSLGILLKIFTLLYQMDLCMLCKEFVSSVHVPLSVKAHEIRSSKTDIKACLLKLVVTKQSLSL